jgi:hypothetical protein
MRRHALFVAFLAGACADGGSLDARMKPMVGASEPALVAAMGRSPDAASQTANGGKLLQWRWQKEYAVADRMLGYSYAGGLIKPVPNTPTGVVRDVCFAEWTVENGIATRYRWQGNDCSLAATELAEPGRP